jgi:hypothetical protein
MNNYNQILDLLRGYTYLGERKYMDGTTLIGKAPHIAPLAWLHSIYAPLSDEHIQRLEDHMKMKMPLEYQEFLKISNGLNVFHEMSLYGYRGNYQRTPEAALIQPFDLSTPNTAERPKLAGQEVFYIGGYSARNGAWIYIDTYDNTVHVCERWQAKSLHSWKNFEEFLLSEIKRLIPLFDTEGKRLDPKKDTRPIKS